MARAIWTGALNFGLVTIPVELYSAVGDHSVHFRQFERGTSDRIRYRRVNERTGKEVDYSDIVKGYELGDGEYVIIEPKELDEIAPGRSRSIDINAFVDVDEIDPIYFDHAYWLAPPKEEFEKAYSLLMKAMAESNKAGIARFVMRGKEYLAAIRPGEHVMVLDTLRFAEDVRDPAKELGKLPKKVEIRGRELDMAISLVESMADEWNPEDYEDTYTERVHKLIESKKKGKAVVTESEPPSPTKVVDLFEALSRSVESRRGKGTDKKAGKGGKKAREGKPPGEDLSALTKAELDARARELGIKGRSKMSRTQLEHAVAEASEPTPKRKKAS